ncbi:MAG: ABC transporter ATP-binding protein [Betaproteobacteria bacterium]|jgi:branched-chain amino acid transport system ATP-binding protein|nr:ABC transporter ATP-binding protein [Betaproteobacteria bacterium]
MTFALEIKNLCKSFGGIKVTQDVSFSVKPGERRLIIGPNGAGKTTLFNQISGELKPDSGSIKVFGEDLTFQPVHRRAHAGVSRTYQIITLFPKDTLLHNVVLSLMGVSNRRFQAFSPLTANDVLFEKAESILDSVGLTGSGHLAAGEISYGEQRRVEIAVAMAQSPRLLLLDEPLAGLSQDERIIVRDLVAALPKTTTIVMIEHDMDVALAFAEQIAVLHYGSLIVEGDRETVVNHPRTREVYLGH